MGHSYEKSKKIALRLIIFLAIITVIEVFISLLGKGHIIDGFKITPSILRFIMVGFSILKAFYIVGEFMHLKYEIKGMPKTILIPLILLPWGIIAFLADGSSWRDNRKEMATDTNRYIKHDTQHKAATHHEVETKVIHSKHDDHNHDNLEEHGH